VSHPVQANKLIAGATAFICGECIDVCNEIIAENHGYMSEGWCGSGDLNPDGIAPTSS